MTPSIRSKLEATVERHEELALLLSQPDVLADTTRFRELSREYAQLPPVADAMRELAGAERELADTHAMREDGELRDMRLEAGQSFRITPGTVHYMEAVTDCDVLEASTPELDDVVRIQDRYGREGTSAP